MNNTYQLILEMQRISKMVDKENSFPKIWAKHASIYDTSKNIYFVNNQFLTLMESGTLLKNKIPTYYSKNRYQLLDSGFRYNRQLLPNTEYDTIKEMDDFQLVLSYGRGILIDKELLDIARNFEIN